jgi:large subunit ribosomal protein L7/L12
VEKMKELTLLEASELVSQIEETFGVDASAPAGGGMVMAAPQGAGGGEEEAEEAQTNFDVVISDVDDSQRIGAIKVLRGLTDLGLKEAKDAMSNLPYTVMEGKPRETCDDAKSQLEEAGATVVRPSSLTPSAPSQCSQLFLSSSNAHFVQELK